jgi:hypothetical protein
MLEVELTGRKVPILILEMLGGEISMVEEVAFRIHMRLVRDGDRRTAVQEGRMRMYRS